MMAFQAVGGGSNPPWSTMKIKESSAKEIRSAVSAAKEAQEKWANSGFEGRAKILSKLYSEFAKRKEELAQLETKQMGMPITQSLDDIDFGLNYFKWYLENSEKYLLPEKTREDDKTICTVYYEPLGAAAVISPWNFPFSNFIWGVIPNLMVGNTVVYKHSEECMLFGKKLDQIIKTIGLPKGVFAEIYGGPKAGNLLVNQDIDIICFTGSTEVGERLYKIAADKMIKIVLELGGSAPGILFEDTDLKPATEAIYSNRFTNCGQVCDGLKRLIVQKPVFNEAVEKIKEIVESKNLGDPQERKTDIGPLVSEKQLKTLELQVKDAVAKGAKIVTGGRRSNLKGAFYLPTILTNIKPNMRVWKEEVFGPVLPIVPFSSEQEAIKLANDTKYGLGGYIFTSDKQKAARVASQIKTGVVAVNNAYWGPENPFGGYKKSGIGREHGKYGLRELCQVKVVTMEK